MKLLGKEIKLTNHFIERYYERVFKSKNPELTDSSEYYIEDKVRKVMEDIKRKISMRDKNNFLTLFNVSQVKLPFAGYQIIVKNGSLITILN